LNRRTRVSKNSSQSLKKAEPEVSVLSHKKDADGICSAALIYHLTKGNVFLTDYAEMIETLSKMPQSKETYICDLGLNSTTFEAFLEIAKKFLEHGKLHYIDHHPLDPIFQKQLTESGVDIFHSVEESAAVLVYRKFEPRLADDPKMRLLACYGAITDYMDLQPLARKLIASFDRQFLLYESTVLSFSIAMIGREGIQANLRLVEIVEELGGKRKLPHEIHKASYFAQQFASRSSSLIEEAKSFGKKTKNFAYIKTKESSTGNVANFLVGVFNVPVGVAFKEDGPSHFEISLRSVQDDRHDLGKIVSKISDELKASGGGHSHAAGSRIKRDQFNQFIDLLDLELSRPA
jgi:oligoribonuclease NrnB/cAMP/cGMP phosphodiesterase (DHH superfamily)